LAKALGEINPRVLSRKQPGTLPGVGSPSWTRELGGGDGFGIGLGIGDLPPIMAAAKGLVLAVVVWCPKGARNSLGFGDGGRNLGNKGVPNGMALQ